MRIRNIKPEFWRSDDITALSLEDRLLFIGLWSYVDDNGVGIDDHRRVAADLFAFEDDQNAIREFVREGLMRLSVGPLVSRYEVSGKRYLYINGWDKHQRVANPNKPRYPRPDVEGASLTSDYVEPNEDVRNLPEDLGTGTEGQGNRGTEKKTSSSSPRKRGTRLPDDFTVTADMVSWARDRVPHVDGKTETEKFINYWRAKSGREAVKLDWEATWRNWMLTASERTPTRASPNGVHPTDQNVALLMGTPLRALPGGQS